MKRLSVYLFMLFYMTILCGCNTMHIDTLEGVLDTNSTLSGYSGDYLNATSLSDLEIRLLSGCYGNTLSIEKGYLFDYQQVGLRQLREGMRYLGDKYPSFEFTYTRFSSATKFTNYAVLEVSVAGLGDYEVHIEPWGDGTFDCSDNFYGEIVREDYDSYIEDIIGTYGVTVKSYTTFSSFVGDSLGENATATDVLREFPKLTRITELYVDSSLYADAAGVLEEIICNQHIYGSYVVYYLQSKPVDVGKLREDKLSYPYVCFSSFNS